MPMWHMIISRMWGCLYWIFIDAKLLSFQVFWVLKLNFHQCEHISYIAYSRCVFDEHEIEWSKNIRHSISNSESNDDSVFFDEMRPICSIAATLFGSNSSKYSENAVLAIVQIDVAGSKAWHENWTNMRKLLWARFHLISFRYYPSTSAECK